MENSEKPMQEMYPKSSEGDNKEAPNQVKKEIQIHGSYAVEMPDELPPTEALKYIDEKGRFSDTKIPTEEDLAYWYRKQLRKVGFFVGFAGLVLILIMLSATTKYANAFWELGLDAFSFVIDFIFGLLPESITSWIPF